MYGLDLFSGIGGLTKALERYVRPVAYCENDRYAQAVLLSRMSSGELPRAPIWDDVRSLRGDMLDSSVDIIYGGFPCQDISVAGRGEGLEGQRSRLFFAVARLVSEIRPRFVFLENVSAITVRGSERVVGELCRLRYDCRWGILSASDVGANHERARWWLLAHAMPSEQWRDERQSEAQENAMENAPSNRRTKIWPRESSASDKVANDRREHGKSRGKVARTFRGMQKDGKARSVTERSSAVAYPIIKQWNRWSDGVGWWEREPFETLQDARRKGRKEDGLSIPESLLGRVVDGVLPFRVDRLRGLGNAVVPLQAREAFERLMGLK